MITFSYPLTFFSFFPKKAFFIDFHSFVADCIYSNKRYHHGDQIKTPEPCLSCICKRGLVLCFLRVCPTLNPSFTQTECKIVKDEGKCCPSVKCPNESNALLSQDKTTTDWSTIYNDDVDTTTAFFGKFEICMRV